MQLSAWACICLLHDDSQGPRSLSLPVSVQHRRTFDGRASHAHAYFFLPLLPVLQVYDVLNADRIVVEQGALAYMNEWFGAGEQ